MCDGRPAVCAVSDEVMFRAMRIAALLSVGALLQPSHALRPARPSAKVPAASPGHMPFAAPIAPAAPRRGPLEKLQDEAALAAAAVTASVMAAPTAALADDDGFSALVKAGEAPGGLRLDELSMELLAYFLKTCISWGVPTLAVGFVFSKLIEGAVKARQARADGGADDGDLPPILRKLSGLPDSKPASEREYLKIERLNDKLDSFEFSFSKALGGKQSAIASRRRRTFADSLVKEVGPLTDAQLEALASAGAKFQREYVQLRKKADDAQRDLRLAIIGSRDGDKAAGRGKGPTEPLEDYDAERDEPQLPPAEGEDAPAEGAEASKAKGGGFGLGGRGKDDEKLSVLNARVTAAAKELGDLETRYLKSVSQVLSGPARSRLQKLLKASGPALGGLRGDEVTSAEALEGLLPLPFGKAVPQEKRGHVFVLEFFGDVQASQVKNLREEVTAVLSGGAVERGDEVLLVLNTGGGTVTGYGLAAAQLLRLKAAGLKLTVCVEQVAASGGYMMACTADRLVASPFAVLGSIGVITDIPNVYERLKREGISFQTVTAGKFKRTLTPTKKVEKEDVEKTKSDLAAVLVLFKNFVAEHRPKLLDTIEEVATGETFFGPDALKKNLVDELKTKDDVLLELRDAGKEVYSVKYEEPKGTGVASLLNAAELLDDGALRGALLPLLRELLLAEGNIPAASATSAMLLDEADAANAIRAQAGAEGLGLSADAEAPRGGRGRRLRRILRGLF